jgi:hypothetical protein
LFDPTEKTLHKIPVFVAVFVEWALYQSILAGRNHRLNVGGLQVLDD